jgi:hypothetical protein
MDTENIKYNNFNKVAILKSIFILTLGLLLNVSAISQPISNNTVATASATIISDIIGINDLSVIESSNDITQSNLSTGLPEIEGNIPVSYNIISNNLAYSIMLPREEYILNEAGIEMKIKSGPSRFVLHSLKTPGMEKLMVYGGASKANVNFIPDNSSETPFILIINYN